MARVVLPFVFALTFALRIVNVGSSWDIFVDEISYLRLSQGVNEHLRVELYGKPFYLHPPAFFFLEAGYLTIAHMPSDLIHQVYAVRPLNVMIAGFSAVAIAYLVRLLAGWKSGLVAGTLFAVDPFIVRVNSRNYLETSMLFWILVGYCCLLPAVSDQRRPLPRWRAIATGTAFGLAVLTKDMAAFHTIVPLAMCCLLGWSLPRRSLVIVATVAAGWYAVYPAVVIAVGEWSDFLGQKTRGLMRFTGQIQETGFNQPGGPSFLATIVARLDRFATTYTLIGAGAFAIVILVSMFPGARHRVIVAWAACSYIQISFSIGIGTLEEQFFYFLVIPSIVTTTSAVTLLIRSTVLPRTIRLGMMVGQVAIVLGFVGWSGVEWSRVHLTTRDNGVEQVVRYVEENVPRGSRVAYTNSPMQFVLKGYRIDFVQSVTDIENVRPEYLVLSESVLRSGHNPNVDADDVINWATHHGERVFSFDGRSLGTIAVYRLSEGGELVHGP